MKPFRSQKLRDVMQEAPVCFLCMHDNDGTVVGCHSNSIEDGHGMGQKSHDVLAALGSECHKYIDEHWKEPGVREQYYHAVYKTFVWLLQSGQLEVK